MVKEDKIVYICSPYSSQNRLEQEQNVLHAKKYGKFALDKGNSPIIVHLGIAELLNDAIPEQRKLGLEAAIKLLKISDELWVFGTKMTPGMLFEIAKASRYGKPIRCFTGLPTYNDIIYELDHNASRLRVQSALDQYAQSTESIKEDYN